MNIPPMRTAKGAWGVIVIPDPSHSFAREIFYHAFRREVNLSWSCTHGEISLDFNRYGRPLCQYLAVGDFTSSPVSVAVGVVAPTSGHYTVTAG
jgi:hypothetical protein